MLVLDHRLKKQHQLEDSTTMTPLKSATTLSAIALAAMVITSPISAQPPQGRGPGMMTGPGPSGQMPPQMPGGMMGMMGQGGMMGMMSMADHVEGRIAFLKAELKITDTQMPQWNAFAEALRTNARRMGEMRDTMQGGMSGQSGASVSAPDRLDRMEKMMTGMTETVKASKSALTPLYAVLTDEQKKMADQLIHGPGMGRM